MLLRLEGDLCRIHEASTASEAAQLYQWRASERVPPDRADLSPDPVPLNTLSDSELLEFLREYQADRFLALVWDRRDKLCGWLELDTRDGAVVETELFGRPIDLDRRGRLAMVAATQILCNHAIRDWNFKAIEARCAGDDRLRYEMLVMAGFQLAWQATTNDSPGVSLRYLRYVGGSDSSFDPDGILQDAETPARLSVPSVPEIPFPNPDDRVYVGPRINLTRTTAAEIPYLVSPPGNPEFHREVDFGSPEQLEDSLRSKLKESELPIVDSSQVLTLWHRRSQEMIGLCFYQWVAPGIGSIHGGLFDIQRRRSGAAAEGLVGAMGYFFREFKPNSLVNLVRADNLAVITLLMGLGWYGIGSYEESNSRPSLIFEIQQQDFGEQKIVRYLWGDNE